MHKKNFLQYIIMAGLSTILIIVITYSCTHDSEGIGDIREICFEDEILPIFQNSCALSGCHDSRGSAEGLVLNSYSSILGSISPGDPTASPAYTSLTASGEDRMPPDSPVPVQNRQLIRIWIEQGALNTTCQDTTTQDTTTQDPGDGIITRRACFERDILPVLHSSCAISGCHDALTHEEGYVFDNYTGILRAVSPGNPRDSKLYEKITDNDSEERMPPPGYDPLPQEYIDSINNWIIYGALDEECGTSCDTTSEMTFSGNVWPIVELNCRGCHSGTSPSGQVFLTGYDEIAAVVSIGLIPSVLRGTGDNPRMPPTGSLPECTIRQIEIWIENGYENN